MSVFMDLAKSPVKLMGVTTVPSACVGLDLLEHGLLSTCGLNY